jgi:GcrA cell cycle regulator
VNVPDELVPRLKQLWNAGLSAIECGEELGLVGTPDEVRDAVVRAHQAPAKAKIATHPDTIWTDERLATLAKMWGDGASAAEIASVLRNGISRSAVLGKARRLGLTKPKASPIVSAARTGDGRRRNRFRSNLPSRYSASEPDEDPMFAVDGIDGTPAPADLDIPAEQRKTLLQLTDKTCKWPVGDLRDPGFFFCGGEPLDGFPYCRHHARRAYAGRPVRKPTTDYRRTA